MFITAQAADQFFTQEAFYFDDAPHILMERVTEFVSLDVHSVERIAQQGGILRIATAHGTVPLVNRRGFLAVCSVCNRVRLEGYAKRREAERDHTGAVAVEDVVNSLRECGQLDSSFPVRLPNGEVI